MRFAPHPVRTAVAASLALAVTACTHQRSPTQDQIVYDPDVPRAEYIAEVADEGIYPRRPLEDAFALCDELASLEAAGTDVGNLTDAERARMWRRILWPDVANQDVPLPGGESDASALLPARGAVCPELAARFRGMRPPNDSPPAYPAPPGAEVDEAAASSAAEAACGGLPVGADATDVVRAAQSAAGELPEAHVYAWMYDHCPGRLDAARVTHA